MSDEEKEALEILKGFEPDDLVECSIYLQALEKITNLIEKQQKEIEDLKDIQQQICNEELITKEYVKENYIHKNIIKAKIEKLEERADEDNLDDFIKINVLQMLLEEKE